MTTTADPWTLSYEGYDPGGERLREALCALGNGVFVTPGAAPESDAVDGRHYPGTYRAGLYNRLDTTVAGRVVTNEDLINLPNWLVLKIKVDDGPWWTPDDNEILDYRQELDLRRGVLTRWMQLADDQGRQLLITQRRVVSMAAPQLAGLQTTVRLVNFSGRITVRSAIDGAVENLGVARYQTLAHQHFDDRATGSQGDLAWVRVRTSQSRIEIAVVARTVVSRDGDQVQVDRAPADNGGLVGHDLTVQAAEGQEWRCEKVVGLVTSRDTAISEALTDAVKLAGRAPRFDALLERHVLAWRELWDRFELTMSDGQRCC